MQSIASMRDTAWLFASLALLASYPLPAVELNFDTDRLGNPIAPGTPVNTAYPGVGVTFSDNAVIVFGGRPPVSDAISPRNFATGLNDTTVMAEFDPPAELVQFRNVGNSSFFFEAFDKDGFLLDPGGLQTKGVVQTANINEGEASH